MSLTSQTETVRLAISILRRWSVVVGRVSYIFTNSTLLFFAFPAAEVLSATGCVAPLPSVVILASLMP